MLELSLEEITRAAEGTLVSEGRGGPVKGFSIDSRTIAPGEMFIAVKGRDLDGHHFIPEALSRGASGVIMKGTPSAELISSGRHFIVAGDTLKAMAGVASSIMRTADIPVIGITGTNGKTTVKDITSALLSSKYEVLKSEASYNNIFGVCLTIFGMKSYHRRAVIEIGTNSPGEIAFLSRICSPEAVIITNIGCGHLDGLVDRGGVLREKLSILERLSRDDIAILNGDDDLLARVEPPRCRFFFCGTGRNCGIRISDITTVPDGIEFKVDGEKFFFPGQGRHNAYNVAFSVAMARMMGITKEQARNALRDIRLPSMRLQKVELSGLTFFNDAYNANPGSFRAAIEVLETFPAGTERWVVAGDMNELGLMSDDLHRSLGMSIAAAGVDFLITLGERSKETRAGAIEAGMSPEKTYAASSHNDAASKIARKAPPGTAVLVKGSRSMKMEEVIRCFTTCCIP